MDYYIFISPLPSLQWKIVITYDKDVVSKKLSKIIFIFCTVSLIYIIFAELPFFGYVKTFGLRTSVYRKIDNIVDTVGIILTIPASFLLFRLLNLHKRGFKTKALLYAVFSLIIPLLLFLSITAGVGDISSEYRSYSGVYWPRLYFRLFLSSLLIFYVWAFLANLISLFKKRSRQILIQFGITIGLVTSSFVLAAVFIYIIDQDLRI